MAEGAPDKKARSFLADRYHLPHTSLICNWVAGGRGKGKTSQRVRADCLLVRQPQQTSVLSKLVGCRNIAKHSSHIKNVELQLQQLQLQLNLTSGPKKSALEMLRKKIEAKNEEVVLARNKFLSAQKVQLRSQCRSAVIMLNAFA